MTTYCKLNNQQTKPMIDCIKYEQEEEELSPQQRSELILNDAYKHRTFISLDISNVKKTFCYSMQYHINIVSAYCYINNLKDEKIINMIYCFFVIEYFVKIYEDHQFKPIKIAKQLKSSNLLKDTLSNDLIIPLDAKRMSKPGIRISHKYDIVRYDFISHVTLEHIALKTIQSKQLNPFYFLQKQSNPYITPWVALGYKLKMLHIFYRVIQIVINMYRLKLVDLDISPDNFIIKTLINGQFQWKEVIASKLFKIDHESTITFKNGIIFAFQTNKPMKPYCIPPEISSYIILNDPYKNINVEQFSVYQIAATFIYILFGQVYKNGLWYTLSVGADIVNERALEWSPKFDLPDDLAFLSDCMAFNPSKRPTFKRLAKYVLNSIEVTNGILLSINTNLPRKISKRPNNLYANYHNYNNNGRVEIMCNPQSTQQNNAGFTGFNQLQHRNNYIYNGYGQQSTNNGYNQFINNQQQQPSVNNDENNNYDDYEDDEDAVNYD